MKLPKLFLTIMSTTFSMTLKQTTNSDRFTFEGLDFRNPSKIASFNLSGQVRDTILRNVPAPAPAENLGVRSTGTGTGTLVLSE